MLIFKFLYVLQIKMSALEQIDNLWIEQAGSILLNMGLFTLNTAFVVSYVERYNSVGIFSVYIIFVIVGLSMMVYAYKRTKVKEEPKCVDICKE
jgi:uncharacterized membrane protein